MNLVPLTRSLVGPTADLTAEAFHNYEAYQPMLPDPERRRRVLRYLHRVLYRYGLAWGNVHVALDGDDGDAPAGVAFWMPASRQWFGQLGMAWQGLFGLPFVSGCDAFNRLHRYFNFLDDTRKKVAPANHAYLCVLATRPSRQRSGVGTALLRPELARLDQANTPAYLETTTEINLAYYQRFGFEVVDDSVGPDAIRTWGDASTRARGEADAMMPLWLQGWLTPCPWAAARLGYLREVLNIKRCGHVWHAAWEPHFECTRQLIRQAIARCGQRRLAVVLGSGWLHDVPLEDLASQFEEVRLVDVIHPLPIRWRVRRYANVKLVHHDITGTTESIYRQPTEPLPVSSPTLFLDEPRLDLTASVNILSQLPYLHVEHLLGRIADRETIFAYARQVIRAHLTHLDALPGVKALIADIASTRLSPQGQVRDRTSTVYGEPFAWSGETWSWTLVPRQGRPPYDTFVREVHGVIRENPPRDTALTLS